MIGFSKSYKIDGFSFKLWYNNLLASVSDDMDNFYFFPLSVILYKEYAYLERLAFWEI